MDSEHIFGGSWTLLKLETLKKYLTAYGTALKNTKYKVVYIDAFAGNGECVTKEGKVPGSVKIALECNRFDEYNFIELNTTFANQLKDLKSRYPDKKISIYNNDANTEIRKVLKKYNWTYTRGVLFLDPYKLDIDNELLKEISKIKGIDIWYLYPISNLTRILKKNNKFTESEKQKLDFVFGDYNWETEFYQESNQLSFLESENYVRIDQKNICCKIKNYLEQYFPLVLCPTILKNDKNSALFALFFVLGNDDEKAKNLAKSIANHILNKNSSYLCTKEYRDSISKK